MSTKQSLLFFELCVASHKGHLDRVLELLEDGADVTLADYDMRTALHIAASDGHVLVVDALIEAGGNVLAKDRWGRSPVDDAVSTQHVDCLAAMQEALRRQGYREVQTGGHGSASSAKGGGGGGERESESGGGVDAPSVGALGFNDAFGSRCGSESDIARLGLALGGDSVHAGDGGGEGGGWTPKG